MDRDALVLDLATRLEGASGADLAYLCQSAARRCVQEAVLADISSDQVEITLAHLQHAMSIWQAGREDGCRCSPR